VSHRRWMKVDGYLLQREGENETEKMMTRERRRTNDTGFLDRTIPARYFHYSQSSPKNIIEYIVHLHCLFIYIIINYIYLLIVSLVIYNSFLIVYHILFFL